MDAALKNNVEMSVEELGAWLGYPDCCTAFFAWRLYQVRRFGRLIQLPEVFPLHGTGFVPCPSCCAKSETELRIHINAHRQCPTPFPDFNP